MHDCVNQIHNYNCSTSSALALMNDVSVISDIFDLI